VSLFRTKSYELDISSVGDKESQRVAVVSPGRGDSQEYEHIRELCTVFAELGCLAIGLDPPGTGRSSGKYRLDNFEQALEELIDEHPDKKIILAGHSRGGAMSLWVGCQNPAVTHMIAIMSRAEGSQPSEAQATKKTVGRDFSSDSAETVTMRFDQDYFINARGYNVLPRLAICEKPKLFIYGERDDIITPEMVQATYQAAAEIKQIRGVDAPHHYRHEPKALHQVSGAIYSFAAETQL